MSAEKKTYAATMTGFILGRFREEGEELNLTDAQAEWELRAGRVRRIEQASPAPAAGRKKPRQKKEAGS
jgi:hypothetical protein